MAQGKHEGLADPSYWLKPITSISGPLLHSRYPRMNPRSALLGSGPPPHIAWMVLRSESESVFLLHQSLALGALTFSEAGW